MIGRILAKHMDDFHFHFGDVVEWHISHKYSEEMAKKSEIVSFPIVYKFKMLSIKKQLKLIKKCLVEYVRTFLPQKLCSKYTPPNHSDYTDRNGL